MEFLEDPRFPELLHRATRQGVVAEIFLQHTQAWEIAVHRADLESQRASEVLGMGLRVEKDCRVGHASTTDLSNEGLEECLREALELAELSERAPAPSIPEDEADAAPLVELGGAELSSFGLQARIDAAREAEEAAFSADPRIQNCENALWSDERVTTRVLNSHGLDRSERRAELSLSVDVVAASGGEERTAHHLEYRRRPGDLDPGAVGRVAAAKALSLLGSTVHETRRCPVLLHHEVVAELLELLSRSFSARACLLGTSQLSSRRDEQVAAACIDLKDDPFHPEGTGGIAIDDEGRSARGTVLLESGVLRSFLHNAHTARRMGEENTANALRASFAGAVGVGPSMLVLEAGRPSVEQILADLPEGFHVGAVMGLHMADPVSGDFSLGIVGHRVERGGLAEPVEGMTIAGNLLGILASTEEIASDFHAHGDLGCASLLVGGLTVSGR